MKRNDWLRLVEVDEKKEVIYRKATKEGRDWEVSVPITRRLNKLDLSVPLTYSNMIGFLLPMPSLCHLSLVLGMKHGKGVEDVWTDYLEPLGKSLLSLKIRQSQEDFKGIETYLPLLNEKNFKIIWFKKLVELDVTNHGLPCGVWEDIDQLSYLKKLWIDSNNISEEELEKISSLPNLTSLSINNCIAFNTRRIPISVGNNLTYLAAGNNSFSDETISSIFRCVNLKELFLPSVSINSARTLNDIRNLQDLTKLDLSNVELGDEIMKQIIGTLTQLQHLQLYNTGISLDGVEHLTNLPNLTYLNIGNNPLMTGKCSNMSKLTKLTILNLPNCFATITGELASQLLPLKLKSLNIKGNTIGEKEFLQICSIPTLKVMTISKYPNEIIDQGRQLNHNLMVIERISKTESETHPPLKQKLI